MVCAIQEKQKFKTFFKILRPYSLRFYAPFGHKPAFISMSTFFIVHVIETTSNKYKGCLLE